VPICTSIGFRAELGPRRLDAQIVAGHSANERVRRQFEQLMNHDFVEFQDCESAACLSAAPTTSFSCQSF
jgi:hypothetical protein